MTLSDYLNVGDSYVQFAKVILFAVANFLVVDSQTFEILFYLMVIDTFFGAVKSIYLKLGFTFKKLLWGLLTKIGILIIPVTLALLAKGLSFDFRWFVVLVMHILLISETFSIITNVLSVKQKKEIKNVDFVSILLRAIRTGLMNIIQRLISQIEKGEKKD